MTAITVATKRKLCLRPRDVVARLPWFLLLIAYFIFHLSLRNQEKIEYLTPKAASAPEHITDVLRKQLLRIRDAENWHVMGDVNKTGEPMYEDVGEGQGEEANIAFFIQISPTNVILVPRLLSRIWHPGNIYCLHIDEKLENDALVDFKEALKSNAKLSNVFLLPSNSITYAGVSMLVNTLDGMHALLQSKSSWDYFINLSGSDYPLISITAMRRLLGMPSVKNQSTNFVHFSTNVASWEKMARHRLGILHFDFSLGFRSNHTIQLTESRMRHPVLSSGNLKLIVAKGESWIMVHRSFCEYAAHGNVARRLLTLFANMQSPSEHFFQTLAWNHLQLNKTLATHSFRDVVWKHGGIRSIQHPYIVDKREPNGSWPFWDDIALSPNFFSRKFSIPDSPMLDQIDLLKSGATEKAANLTAVYQSFAIVKNRFACVTEHGRSRKRPHVMPCFFSGWMERGCRGGQTELCVSDVPPPGSQTKLFSFSTPWKK